MLHMGLSLSFYFVAVSLRHLIRIMPFMTPPVLTRIPDRASLGSRR